MLDDILKITIYWHLKYSCKTLFFMSEEEREKECRKFVEKISGDSELWEFLKSYIGRDETGLCTENLDLKFSFEKLKIPFLERAILMGLKDADYLIRLQEQEKRKIPLKFS